MKPPFFSIIVVSLNAKKTIASTIESILNQTFDDYEIIIKDGGSQDNTLEYIPQNEKIKTIVKKDCNVYDGMNQATAEATGKYVFYLNCGDRFYNNSVLSNIYNLAISLEEPAIIYGDVFQEDWGRVLKQNKTIDKYFWYRTTLCHQSVFFPLIFLKGEFTYNTEYSISADFALLLELFISNKSFVYLDDIIAIYEGAGLSASKEGVIKNREQKHKIINKNYNIFSRGCYFCRKCIDCILKKSFV